MDSEKNGEFKGTIKSEVRHLNDEIKGLKSGQKEMIVIIKESHTEIIEKFDGSMAEHIKYHENNEHRWGIPKVLRNNLVKLIVATAVIVGSGVLFFSTGKFNETLARYLIKILPL